MAKLKVSIRSCPILMEGSILDSIKIVGVEREFIPSLIKIAIGDLGRKTSFQVKVSMSMSLVKGIKASSLMAKNMEQEFITSEVELFMTDSGTKIENMDMEHSFIQIMRDTKEIG